MIAVVDASALVELCTADDQDAALLRRLAEVMPHVPDVVDVEFHHALRGLLLGNKVSRERVELARELFRDIPLHRFPSAALMDRVWTLRHNLAAYDACYIVLAEVLQVPLITCDKKQQTAAGHQARVEAF